MAEHNNTGKSGEEQAAEFLKDLGYDIKAVNWRCRQYEIDIIAIHKNTLVIAEVKTRKGNYFGEPEVFVTRTKQKNIIKGAQEYIKQNNLDLETRFDIISVLQMNGAPQIKHIPEAFYPIL